MNITPHQLERELAELLKSYGCSIEANDGTVWLIELPLDILDDTSVPVNLTELVHDLERRMERT
jgi:hypothetical protein